MKLNVEVITYQDQQETSHIVGSVLEALARRRTLACLDSGGHAYLRINRGSCIDLGGWSGGTWIGAEPGHVLRWAVREIKDLQLLAVRAHDSRRRAAVDRHAARPG